MSKKYPECPLVKHDNCKDLYSPKLCAIVRKDKICLRKLPKSVNKNGLKFSNNREILFKTEKGGESGGAVQK